MKNRQKIWLVAVYTLKNGTFKDPSQLQMHISSSIYVYNRMTRPKWKRITFWFSDPTEVLPPPELHCVAGLDVSLQKSVPANYKTAPPDTAYSVQLKTFSVGLARSLSLMNEQEMFLEGMVEQPNMVCRELRLASVADRWGIENSIFWIWRPRTHVQVWV